MNPICECCGRPKRDTHHCIGRDQVATPTLLEQVQGRYAEIEREAELKIDDETDAFHIGYSDGFSEAVRLIDQLTGGDGEYRCFLAVGGDGQCSDPSSMIQRIVERMGS